MLYADCLWVLLLVMVFVLFGCVCVGLGFFVYGFGIVGLLLLFNSVGLILSFCMLLVCCGG